VSKLNQGTVCKTVAVTFNKINGIIFALFFQMKFYEAAGTLSASWAMLCVEKLKIENESI